MGSECPSGLKVLENASSILVDASSLNQKHKINLLRLESSHIRFCGIELTHQHAFNPMGDFVPLGGLLFLQEIGMCPYYYFLEYYEYSFWNKPCATQEEFLLVGHIHGSFGNSVRHF